MSLNNIGEADELHQLSPIFFFQFPSERVCTCTLMFFIGKNYKTPRKKKTGERTNA
jgi:hypothetical protein